MKTDFNVKTIALTLITWFILPYSSAIAPLQSILTWISQTKTIYGIYGSNQDLRISFKCFFDDKSCLYMLSYLLLSLRNMIKPIWCCAENKKTWILLLLFTCQLDAIALEKFNQYCHKSNQYGILIKQTWSRNLSELNWICWILGRKRYVVLGLPILLPIQQIYYSSLWSFMFFFINKAWLKKN